DGISPKWTVNLSPVLTEQLASPEFQKELSFYYENVRRACVESREHFTKQGRNDIVRLTLFWEEFYERMWELHRRIGADIPAPLRPLPPPPSASPTPGPSPARPPTAPCPCSRATNRPPCSGAPPSRPPAATSDGRPAASGCPSARTGRATSGRRPPGATAAASA